LFTQAAGYYCSMLQDLENHRPTEIDAINGAVVRAVKKESEVQ
jgi:ketopantoate reductase